MPNPHSWPVWLPLVVTYLASVLSPVGPQPTALIQLHIIESQEPPLLQAQEFLLVV